METFKDEVRDGMRIDWDMPIEMDDGVVLCCDVYRPMAEGKYPAIISYGPYAKWLHLKDGYPNQWRVMTEKHPETVAGTSNQYQNWEVVDPEKWVPDGPEFQKVLVQVNMPYDYKPGTELDKEARVKHEWFKAFYKKIGLLK